MNIAENTVAAGTATAPGAVYLAPYGFVDDLAEELTRSGRRIVFRRERLLGTAQGPWPAAWAQNIWLEPRFLPCASVREGVSGLKSLQRNWTLYSTLEHRRAALIAGALPPVAARPQVFGRPAPSAALGSWTLWSRERILASPRCSSPFANGEAHFVEDKEGPPNRAYLKLWELFTRLGRAPGPGEVCLDLGSSPGGWTWVLAGLGARVFSVDKAPLAAPLERHPLVEHCRGSAFAVDADLAHGADWIFSDVACYPERLYALVRRWIEADVHANLVCTIKFAGETDFKTLDLFRSVSGSACLHLFANKHEVTWTRLVK